MDTSSTSPQHQSQRNFQSQCHPPMSSSRQQHYPYMQPSPTPTVVSQHVINDNNHNPEIQNQDKQPSYDLEKGIINHTNNSQEIIEDDNYQHKDVKKKKKKKDLKDRNCCIRCCCCSCLPKWARYVIWIIIIAIIIVIIIIGSIFATFKMPTFDMVGLDTSTARNHAPSASYSISDGSINFKFALKININNPNIFPLHFANMKTTAYYPIPPDSGVQTNVTKIRIGSGYLDSIWIPKETNMTFSYPFEIQYSPSLDVDQFVLNSLTEKCGLTGEKPQDLSIEYDIELAASALFVTLHPMISSSAQFKCPLTDGSLDNVALSSLD